MSALSRLNTFLNPDLRSPNVENRPNIDSIWNDLVNSNNSEVESVNKQRNSVDGNMPLSRLLAQTYSYSSDSSNSPHGTSSRFSPSQISNRGSGVFSYSDESPQSSGSGSSRQSFSYSNSGSSFPSRSLRLSSVSDPGSPTLDDAIMMGGLPDTPFVQNATSGLSSPNSKVKEFTLSELMNSLSVSNSGSSNDSPLAAGNSSCNQNPSSSAILSNSLGLSGNFGLNGNQSNFNPNLNLTQPRSQAMDLNSLAQFQNMWLTSQLPNLVDSSSLFGGIGDFRNLRGSPNSPPLSSSLASLFPGTDPYAIEKAAKMHRSAAALCDATCTWSGPLPVRMTKNPFYSCKVFLGGVPWDVTELALRQAFLQFGSIQVEWPGKENSANPPKGYVYILFENEKQVKALLAACTQDFHNENYYYKISSRRMRQKEVQVIPWVISDSNYVRCPSYQLDPAKTVFVGALHGMLSAEGLANIMNDLFGGVVYSGIDTDKHKYPIGSGRVTFNNEQSYRKAVRAAFIEIKTPKFTKKVQVDPYLADSPCQLCCSQQGPYFCRDENCFKYYCRSCWQITHIGEVSTHKPLMRDPKLRTPTTMNRVL